MEKIINQANTGEVIIYQTTDGKTAVDVRLENDSVWLSQEMMSLLFKKDRTVIGRHIRKIYKDGELQEEGTCAKIAHMGTKGVQPYNRVLYNLDVIISVGYRVHSQEGVLFRIWATSVLKEYHIGASLKDLGKKWFAFSLMNDLTPEELISRL